MDEEGLCGIHEKNVRAQIIVIYKITAEYTPRFYDITKARIHRTLNGVLYPFATNFS